MAISNILLGGLQLIAGGILLATGLTHTEVSDQRVAAAIRPRTRGPRAIRRPAVLASGTASSSDGPTPPPDSSPVTLADGTPLYVAGRPLTLGDIRAHRGPDEDEDLATVTVLYADAARRPQADCADDFPRGVTRGQLREAVRRGEAMRAAGRRASAIPPLGRLRPRPRGVSSASLDRLIAWLHANRERERSVVAQTTNAHKRTQTHTATSLAVCRAMPAGRS